MIVCLLFFVIFVILLLSVFRFFICVRCLCDVFLLFSFFCEFFGGVVCSCVISFRSCVSLALVVVDCFCVFWGCVLALFCLAFVRFVLGYACLRVLVVRALRVFFVFYVCYCSYWHVLLFGCVVFLVVF